MNPLTRCSAYIILGGTLGCATAFVIPTMAPIAGFINGACFAVMAGMKGQELLDRFHHADSAGRKLLAATALVIGLIASAALGYLACLALSIPITFTACLMFPWVCGFALPVIFVRALLLTREALNPIFNCILR